MNQPVPYKYLYLFDNKALMYSCGKFYVADGVGRTLVAKCALSSAKRVLARIRVTNRMLRLEPRATERLSEHKFVIGFAHKIWVLDIKAKVMRVVYESRPNWSDTLNFCSDGKSIYWGEYGGNAERGEVNVYKLSQKEEIDVVYTFPSKSIRHIHNILFDSDERCFWIFAGDNDEEAGIYRATDDWQDIRPMKTGEQRFRAVVGFPHNGGVIYATDSVSDPNFIYTLDKDGVLRKLAAINGSCIYGTETLNHYIFSTTVEPPEGGGFLSLLSNKLGGGILSRDVQVVSVRKSDLKVRVITTQKKDWLPMKLFQYGAVMFPKGQDKNDKLWLYVMACKTVDGKSILIGLD